MSFVDQISFRNEEKNKKRVGASVNAYLILRKGGDILFQLRKNTGYCDGLWSLVAGHVEDGESATFAIIREANEEIGLTFSPSQLRVVHVLHRKTNRLNVDIFFDCPFWEGEVENREKEKCEELRFFSSAFLPSHIVDYNKEVLEHIAKGVFYSETGWQ